MSNLPSRDDNPDGLHQRYCLTKANGRPCEPGSKYFVLRLDECGRDKAHIAACRMAARTYIRCVPKHMRKVAEELADWAGLEPDDGLDTAQIDAKAWRTLVQFGFSLNWLGGDSIHKPGWVVSYEHKPVEMDDDGWQTRYSTQIEAITAAANVIKKANE